MCVALTLREVGPLSKAYLLSLPGVGGLPLARDRLGTLITLARRHSRRILALSRLAQRPVLSIPAAPRHVDPDGRCAMHQRGPVAPPALRLVTGERYADWEAIYQDNAIWVYRMLYAKVGNRPDAEDLTDEVFLAALRPLRVSATAPEVRAYLRRASATSPTRPNAGHRAPGAARMCAADQLLNNSGLVTPCAPSAPVGR